MGAAIRAYDWVATSLGPIGGWPQSLLAVLRILLTSRYAMWLAWGPELTFFCNDAYRPTLGHKAGWALGSPAQRVWAEIWPDIGPRIERVLQTGQATWDDGLLLFLERSGYPEETYHTFSYSPAPNDAGGVGGMLCVVAEETERVLGERRLATLAALAASLAGERSEAAMWKGVVRGLDENPRDLPFTLTYLFEPDGNDARLVAYTGLDADHPFAADANPLWSTWPALAAGMVVIDDLDARAHRAGADVPTGAIWPEPSRQAVVLPLLGQREDKPAGFVVAAINPFRPLDDAYRDFLRLIVGQIAAGLSAVRAYEEERRRAEALAELDRTKTAFFSNVSHEFRTPLTLMLAPLEDVLNGARLADTERQQLEIAHRNSLRLLRLVNTLLDFSRLEAGRLQPSFEPIDLAVLTADTASGFRSATERAGLTLDIACEPIAEPVYVDRDMWEKVTLNLLSNAFKFTFDGGVAIALRRDGSNVVLAVSDTGVGIPEHELTRVFERFHRIEGQRSRTFEGSGIGLALSSELVRLHGGTIEASSVPGRGSTFTVTLPLGFAHLPADRIGATQQRTGTRREAFVEEAMRWLPDVIDASATTSTASAALSGPMPRILVADDNADMRAYVARLLRDRYEVTAVPDGAAALAALRTAPADLLLSDVMMPGLDGFGLLRAIRADPTLRRLPVILLSARAGEEARSEGLDAGADDYITKPFSARELLARVSANLTMARLRQDVGDALRARTAELERAQAALRQANEELEHRVEERTSELLEANRRLREEIAERERTEDILRQSQKMEAVGQLTGGIAHDFNNLLTGIIGSLELLAARAAQGRVRDLGRYIAAARGAADRAAALTHRLLAFSRRQTLEPKSVNANRLIGGIEELIRRTIGPAIDLEVVKAVGLWTTLCDPNQLENALLNLCINARDAMPDGGRLTIETENAFLDVNAAREREIAPGQYIGIHVTDNGVGMAPEVVLRAFDPFFTTKPLGQGTGLGLSMIYGFARQSGGQVRIYSEVGRGTSVKLYLPRHHGADAVESDEAAQPAADLRAHENETVLVVDDEPTVRMLVTEVLADLGYTAIEADDGPAGLRILSTAQRVDLLITDVGLPGGMNGRQLADAARVHRPDLKVLFITGYAENAVFGNGLLEPGMQVIAKPFAMEVLATRIRVMISGV